MSVDKEPSAEQKSPQEELDRVLRYGSRGEKMWLAHKFASGRLESAGCDKQALGKLGAEAKQGRQHVMKILDAASVDTWGGSEAAAALRMLAEEGWFDPAEAGISEAAMDPHRTIRPLEAY